jgi:hypothetical protein
LVEAVYIERSARGSALYPRPRALDCFASHAMTASLDC